ncbi:MAG: chloramphenicol O-acetyltransferase type A [Flavobacterium sp.]|jgi:chloramphenicol O-acetyltransferase type A
MKEYLDIETWNRKEHFAFFSKMEEPFFGVTSIVDCTNSYQKAKFLGISFFIYYLHKTLQAVNAIENFRYRIEDDKIAIYNHIDASATIMREDKTFGFSYIKFADRESDFDAIATSEINRIQKTTGLFTTDYPENLIHFSALPWVNFTSLSHARSFTWPDSCPKISFGKLYEENGAKKMAISIHAHHGLMDGYHVGLFLEELQKLL